MHFLISGVLYLPVGMTVSVHSTSSDPLEFTLYCISTGGPVTTVTWTKDSVELEGGVTLPESARFSRYTHSLNATEDGVYNCTVSNNQTSVTAELNITGMWYHRLYFAWAKKKTKAPPVLYI